MNPVWEMEVGVGVEWEINLNLEWKNEIAAQPSNNPHPSNAIKFQFIFI
jgi:hypothetical protein